MRRSEEMGLFQSAEEMSFNGPKSSSQYLRGGHQEDRAIAFIAVRGERVSDNTISGEIPTGDKKTFPH